MNGFPLSAEQIVRLVAAVMTELNPPKGTKLDRRESAVLLRLADSVGVPIETFERPQGPTGSAGGPRPRSTRGLGVQPYSVAPVLPPIDYAGLAAEFREAEARLLLAEASEQCKARSALRVRNTMIAAQVVSLAAIAAMFRTTTRARADIKNDAGASEAALRRNRGES